MKRISRSRERESRAGRGRLVGIARRLRQTGATGTGAPQGHCDRFERSGALLVAGRRLAAPPAPCPDMAGHPGGCAGAEPTASAVVADVVDVVRALTSDPENRVPHLAFQPDAIVEQPVLSAEQFTTAYYLRLTAEDKPGVLAEVTKILAIHQISIEAIIQKEPEPDKTTLPVIMLTQKTLEKEMNAAIAEIEALQSISGKVSRIRLETLG